MPKIIVIHSFRRGTGKTNLAANVAALIAAEGRRVGVVDANLLSPSLYLLFGLREAGLRRTLNDYLWGKCPIQETAHDVTAPLGAPPAGQVFLIPSSPEAGEIARMLRQGYDVKLLGEGFHQLIEALSLEALVVDTHAGLSEATLFCLAVSDALALILRPDQQDYQGTAITVEVARKLEAPRIVLIVNEAPPVFDLAEVKSRIEQTYKCEVAGVLPHSEDLMALAGGGIFALRYPDDPLTTSLKQITARLAAV